MLWYQCAVCKKMVCHNGRHWIDDGTEMFCPECGGTTVVRLTTRSTRPATAAVGELTEADKVWVDSRPIANSQAG
jgi:DNA-directed RNA polymerase subunit RPC12/RpoP